MNWSEDLEKAVVLRPDGTSRVKNEHEMNDLLAW